eukprot:CCRYP_003287-RA/>CCRYP_003287-RA protein AED:0.71 eAED:0.62 QI:0/0/0/0.66/0/0/3/0/204
MCFSCGFDVKGWHTSAICCNKKPGHQDGCTRENAQAYKDAGHKSTIYEETDDDDKATVIASNVSCKDYQLTATTTASSNGDPSGTPTNTCLQDLPLKVTQPTTTQRPALKPLTICLPNGKHIVSTHTCNLDLPWLPHSTSYLGYTIPPSFPLVNSATLDAANIGTNWDKGQRNWPVEGPYPPTLTNSHWPSIQAGLTTCLTTHH